MALESLLSMPDTVVLRYSPRGQRPPPQQDPEGRQSVRPGDRLDEDRYSIKKYAAASLGYAFGGGLIGAAGGPLANRVGTAILHSRMPYYGGPSAGAHAAAGAMSVFAYVLAIAAIYRRTNPETTATVVGCSIAAAPAFAAATGALGAVLGHAFGVPANTPAQAAAASAIFGAFIAVGGAAVIGPAFANDEDDDDNFTTTSYIIRSLAFATAGGAIGGGGGPLANRLGTAILSAHMPYYGGVSAAPYAVAGAACVFTYTLVLAGIQRKLGANAALTTLTLSILAASGFAAATGALGAQLGHAFGVPSNTPAQGAAASAIAGGFTTVGLAPFLILLR